MVVAQIVLAMPLGRDLSWSSCAGACGLAETTTARTRGSRTVMREMFMVRDDCIRASQRNARGLMPAVSTVGCGLESCIALAHKQTAGPATAPLAIKLREAPLRMTIYKFMRSL